MGMWIPETFYVVRYSLDKCEIFDTINELYIWLVKTLGTDAPSISEIEFMLEDSDGFELDNYYHIYRDYTEHYEEFEEDD